MRVAVFSSHGFDREFLAAANRNRKHELVFLETRLTSQTAVLAAGQPAVCAFVNDQLDREVLSRLSSGGTRLVALRSAGFNHVDLSAAKALGMVVSRVPAYSPHAVAEHTVALVLTLNRKIHRAYGRVREGNFALDGLLGFDLHGRTVGIVGTGRIGAAVAGILKGFGCRTLGFDPQPSEACRSLGVEYVPFDRLLEQSSIVTLHTPLTSQTRHLIDAAAIARMPRGVMIINTGRGGLVDTPALIEGLKSGQIGYLGLDVYEEEEGLFFEDRSSMVLLDDVFARLLTFPNVIVTGHQAFFTHEALQAIAETTLSNIDAFEQGYKSGNELLLPDAAS
jgi:D-lactate dehydrogenase